jgi:AraC-like DNA-binding protein
MIHLSTGIAASLFFPVSYLFVQTLYKLPVKSGKYMLHLLPFLVYAGLLILCNQGQDVFATRFFYNVFDYGIAILYSVPLLIEFHSRAEHRESATESNAKTSEGVNANIADFEKKEDRETYLPLKSENLHKVDGPEFTKEQIESMKTAIEGGMMYSEPYLKQKFSLPDLAELTNISVHQLSAFINWYYKMNYSDFINMYRVEYCKRKIVIDEEWQYLTLQAIAEESGFGNRNTFTAAFKKFTNSTPMEFLKQLKMEKLRAAV